MAERRVRVGSKVGLHARPAAVFVRAAAEAPVDVTIARRGRPPVNAKSILAVLGLDVRHDEEVVLAAEGEGAEELLDRLASLVATTEHDGG
ncbi:HPr family phosphocarrier protein [Actinomadura craniellae]|uniref:HPr family phosphocarrier protein n=1 Tax=Actinomadura craniellae TaxID=2231787 RepID=UPI0018F249D7|nr:HPr family phosphocarrier protein [Actinomadura craniellae]